MSYVLQFARDKISHYNAGKKDVRSHLRLNVHQSERGEVVGVVDLMFTLGDHEKRTSAYQQWNRIKQSNPLTKSKGVTPSESSDNDIVVSKKIYSNSMDFCTLVDFYDHILPHITGPIPEIIREARGRTATLVATGSKMATALVKANAEAIEEASDAIRHIVDQTRQATEQLLEEEAQVPIYVMGTGGKESRVRPIVIYNNLPSGQCFYHRSTLSFVLPDMILPTDCKITRETSKVGRADDAKTRMSGNDYRRDCGYYDTIITTRTVADSQALEGCFKSSIRQFRREHAQEYYDVTGYLNIHHIVPDIGQTKVEAAQRHLTRNALITNRNLVDKIYVAQVNVDTPPQETDGSSAQDDFPPPYQVSINYNEVPLESYNLPQSRITLELEREKTSRVCAKYAVLDRAVQAQQRLVELALSSGAPVAVVDSLQKGLVDLLHPEFRSRTLTDTDKEDRAHTVEMEKNKLHLEREKTQLHAREVALKENAQRTTTLVRGRQEAERMPRNDDETIVARFIREMTTKGGTCLLVDLYPAYTAWVNRTFSIPVASHLHCNKSQFIERVKQVRFQDGDTEYKVYTRGNGRTGGGQQGIKGRTLKDV